MTVPVRLALYGAGLVLVFAASAVVADAVVPDEVVDSWTQQVDELRHDATDN